jgi:hypothetical protein
MRLRHVPASCVAIRNGGRFRDALCRAVRVAVTGAGNSGVLRWIEAEEKLADDFSAAAVGGLCTPTGWWMT